MWIVRVALSRPYSRCQHHVDRSAFCRDCRADSHTRLLAVLRKAEHRSRYTHAPQTNRKGRWMKHYLFAATLAFCLPFSPAWAAGNQPVRLVSTTPLPEISGGDFDHFAADLKGNRLYVVAEEYGSIEVFNLRSGEHLPSGRH